MKIHSLCEMFPVLPEAELQQLADDIKAHGQREPILLLKGQVIDGRNRLLACKRAGVKPKTQTVKETNPAALVRSLNIFRRHLSESQRAMLGTELMSSATITEVAQQVKVSPRSVNHAVKVKKKAVAPVKKAVLEGKLPVSKAAKLAEKPKAEQRKIARGGFKAVHKDKPLPNPVLATKIEPPKGFGEGPSLGPWVPAPDRLDKFVSLYRKWWANRVSPSSSAGAPSIAERRMNEQIETLLGNCGAPKLETEWRDE